MPPFSHLIIVIYVRLSLNFILLLLLFKHYCFSMIGGQAKTLMFVHISPEVNAIGETVSTLKFAERVASIELGAARSNKETGEIRELKEEVKISIVQVQFSLLYSSDLSLLLQNLIRLL